MKLLNIITPCSRPQNLKKIQQSINIPRENYRWIVVIDSMSEVNKELLPENAEIYYYVDSYSNVGNAQRNFALDKVTEGYVYFNDDDTIIHPDLWENIKDVEFDFLSFKQNSKNGNLRLSGKNIVIGSIDSHNFIVNYNIIKDNRFIKDIYEADGFFAVDCYNNSVNKLYIDKVLSIYNLLR